MLGKYAAISDAELHHELLFPILRDNSDIHTLPDLRFYMIWLLVLSPQAVEQGNALAAQSARDVPIGLLGVALGL